jgi:hypothetical protein
LELVAAVGTPKAVAAAAVVVVVVVVMRSQQQQQAVQEEVERKWSRWRLARRVNG